MPMYEYACAECGQRFERLVPSSADADRMTCEHCGATEVRRLVSVFATAKANGDGGCCGGGCCRVN
ncbi:MAG: zinc ribbon domain-containing protein [Armatimonadota bacterium]|nr:zinc ribbon domain-containing protein [Armatimonadota bacterium]MDR5698174.1 zinc ribbon domain-containing protein [Armatimonadota bacterium]